MAAAPAKLGWRAGVDICGRWLEAIEFLCACFGEGEREPDHGRRSTKYSPALYLKCRNVFK